MSICFSADVFISLLFRTYFPNRDHIIPLLFFSHTLPFFTFYQLRKKEKSTYIYFLLSSVALMKILEGEKFETNCFMVIVGLSGNFQGSPGGSVVKNLPAIQETQEMWVRSLGQQDPLEEEMATHSSILAWKIPWTEEPDELQSMGLQRVGHD